MRWLAIVALAGCGGASTPSKTSPLTAPAAAAPPTLRERPVWDGPLTDPMALRALDRVRAADADPAPALTGSDPRMWLGPVQMWVERRAKLLRELRADADALASDADPRMQLLATIVLGVAADDLVSDLLALAPPSEVTSAEHGDEMARVFHEALEAQAIPVVKLARPALQSCATKAAALGGPLQVWVAFCAERDASLETLQTRVAARAAAPPPVPRPPAMFSDCDTPEVRHVDPLAPPPDRKAAPVVVYVYGGDKLTGADALTLERAVARKLGPTTRMAVVDDKQLSAARALVRQRKVTARGPVCGQAPPLPAVIAATRHHVIVGEIETTCFYKNMHTPESCGLFVHYTRAGDDTANDVPEPAYAEVASAEVTPAAWLDAVERLRPDGSGGLLGLVGGGGASRVFFDLAKYTDESSWLRVASTFDEQVVPALAACVDAPASFDATLTVSKAGATQKVTLAPVTAAPAGSTVAACVQHALEATAWPCTLDAKPATISVRMCVAPRPAR